MEFHIPCDFSRRLVAHKTQRCPNRNIDKCLLIQAEATANAMAYLSRLVSSVNLHA